MATQVQRRRGTASEHNTFTGAAGEVTVNTTNDSLHVHDGATTGGFETLRADAINTIAPTTLSVNHVVETNHFTLDNDFNRIRLGNLVVNVTPNSASSRFLLMASLHFGGSSDTPGFLTGFNRNGSPTRLGDPKGSGSRAHSATEDLEPSNTGAILSYSLFDVDSPNTTSSVEYEVYLEGTNGLLRVNHNGNGYTDPKDPTTVCSLTVIEFGA